MAIKPPFGAAGSDETGLIAMSEADESPDFTSDESQTAMLLTEIECSAFQQCKGSGLSGGQFVIDGMPPGVTCQICLYDFEDDGSGIRIHGV